MQIMVYDNLIFEVAMSGKKECWLEISINGIKMKTWQLNDTSVNLVVHGVIFKNVYIYVWKGHQVSWILKDYTFKEKAKPADNKQICKCTHFFKNWIKHRVKSICNEGKIVPLLTFNACVEKIVFPINFNKEEIKSIFKKWIKKVNIYV